MQIKYILWVSFMISLLTGCSSDKQTKENNEGEIRFDQSDFSFKVKVKYAKGFAVDNFDTYKRISILDPNKQSDTLAVYLCYPKGTKAPKLTSSKMRTIAVPIQRLATISTTEVGALPILNRRSLLVGCTNLANISDSIIQKRIAGGKIVEIGRGMSKNVEAILKAKPDVLLQDIYTVRDKDEDLRQAGIELVLYNGWKEQTLLGRAEWFKIIALLSSCNRLADERFDEMEQNYKEAKALAQGQAKEIPIMYGQDYNGAWYIPGEYSYVTEMLRDASLRYDYIAKSLNSQPKGFEYVYGKHAQAKVWLSMVASKVNNLQEFTALNPHYASFQAVKEGNVWVAQKRLNKNGGNDYWESAVYHPDWLLKDLVKMTRPELLPDYETKYWLKLSK